MERRRDLEGRHRPPDGDPGGLKAWQESWLFTFAAPDASLAGYAAVTLRPSVPVAWYWCALVGAGRRLVSVVDCEVPMPIAGLELRGHRLWADHVCEAPFERWSVGNETYGVALDDPDEALGAARGDVVAIAFDLEWENDPDAVATAPGCVWAPCHVHGEVHLGGEVLAVDAPGTRAHQWGRSDWGAPWGPPAPLAERLLRAPVRLPAGYGHLERDLCRDADGTLDWAEWHVPEPPA